MLQAILLSIYKYRYLYKNAKNTNTHILLRLIKVKTGFRSPFSFSALNFITFVTEILTNGCLTDIGVVIPGGCSYCSLD